MQRFAVSFSRPHQSPRIVIVRAHCAEHAKQKAPRDVRIVRVSVIK